jgi:hypothetical protein
MAARLGTFPPVALPCDRVTVHPWRWDRPDEEPGTADAERQRGEFQPVIDSIDVADDYEGMVSFPKHHGQPVEVHVVQWHRGEAIYWTGPMWLREGDSASFGPLPNVGTIVAAG